MAGGKFKKEILKWGFFFFFFLGISFRRSPQNVGEVMVRTTNDRWIVGRKSDQREFYVIFDNKNAHLIEINEEVKKLGSTYFQNIFLETWGKKEGVNMRISMPKLSNSTTISMFIVSFFFFSEGIIKFQQKILSLQKKIFLINPLSPKGNHNLQPNHVIQCYVITRYNNFFFVVWDFNFITKKIYKMKRKFSVILCLKFSSQ